MSSKTSRCRPAPEHKLSEAVLEPLPPRKPNIVNVGLIQTSCCEHPRHNLEKTLAAAERLAKNDIDLGMVHGCAHPLGPLALTDLIGLDTTMAVAESMYSEFKEPLYAPPPLLCRMVEAGLLGRKTGRGFHSYAKKA